MLTIAAGIFITCVVISFSILVMHEGMSLGSAFVNSLNEKERDYREYNVAKYDSEILTGAEVINVTRKYQNDMEITIITDNGSRIFTKNNNFNISANYPENDFYIEPYDDYVGRVGRDANGKINRLKFELRRG
ncbi:hypothetical protein GCWU000282_00322 [Catonella morbi ATCC 51271]|uniref:Uncharacterized protein n=2 Tax=Catonella TaxID=43996 RepID=V2Y6S4_9FIRM|nr:hypothetical protein GCWU000282_00322 [Catonella morbi ATCC 51271]